MTDISEAAKRAAEKVKRISEINYSAHQIKSFNRIVNEYAEPIQQAIDEATAAKDAEIERLLKIIKNAKAYLWNGGEKTAYDILNSALKETTDNA